MTSKIQVDNRYYNKYVNYEDKIEREKFIEWKDSKCDEWNDENWYYDELLDENHYIGGSEKAEYEAFMKDCRELIAYIRKKVQFIKNWGIKDDYYCHYLD